MKVKIEMLQNNDDEDKNSNYQDSDSDEAVRDSHDKSYFDISQSDEHENGQGKKLIQLSSHLVIKKTATGCIKYPYLVH